MSTTMPPHAPHPPHHPVSDGPDDLEPEPLPVEPDEGPVPPVIPEDPEHGRVVDPEV